MQLVPAVLIATITGLAVAPFQHLPLSCSWLAVVPGLLAAVCLRKFPKPFMVSLFIFFLLVANLRYTSLLTPREDLSFIDQLAHKTTVTGTVKNVRALTGGRSQLGLFVESVIVQSQPVNLSKPLAVRLYIEEGGDDFLPGDVLRLKSRLRLPRLFGSPGEFDWPRYLVSQHIDMTAWVESNVGLELLNRGTATPKRFVSQWRSTVAKTLQARMSVTGSQLTRALLLGEGKVIPDDVRSTLSKCGVSHLFAISGLHLGLIALFSYRLLFYLYCCFPRLLAWQPPQRILPICIMPLLFVYLSFTGDAIATRRAFVIAALGAVFLIWRYYVNPLQLLLSLALLSLLVNPLLLWQAGWQLSFAGAAGILLWRPWWQHKRIVSRSVYVRFPVQLFVVTLAAMLATFPLVLMNFHLLAPAGIIANLVCVPIITLCVMPIGLLGLIFFPVIPHIATFLFQFCGVILELLLRLAEWFVALPGLGGVPQFLSSGQYLVVGLMVLTLFLFPRIQKNRFGLGVILGFIVVGLWLFPVKSGAPISLTMFSVGQGEALLLRNQLGQSVLVDGGGLYSNRFDVGERLLAPALGELKVNQLDAVVLTHDHPDHRKGLIYLLDNFPVRKFYTGHQLHELHPSLRHVLIRNDTPLEIAASGWHRLPFWHEGDLFIYNGAIKAFGENNSSLVVYLRIDQENGLLLTGDLERDGILDLLETPLPGPVTLLKLPHHGSRYSLTDRLVDVLEPQVCLVSVGYQNRYHFPATAVVNDLKERNIPLYRTDMTGTIAAQLLENEWQIKHWERGLFR